MLKKASTVAAAVAGLMLVGGPAFAVAGDSYEHTYDGSWYFAAGEINHATTDYDEGEHGDVADQFGLLNFGNDSDAASGLNVCQVEINALLGIPILSNNDESVCAATDNDDNDDNDAGHDND